MSRSGAARHEESVIDGSDEPPGAPAVDAFFQRPLARPRMVMAGSGAEAAGTDDVLRSAFDRSPSGMSVSALDGRWLRINDAYGRMLGRQRAELLGRSSADVTHPDDLAADREFASTAVAGKTDSLERDQRFLRQDGSVVWARVHTEVIRDDSGQPLYLISHIQDKSQRRAAEDRLRDSERTLRSMIDNTPAIICVKGRDHRYKLVNRGFEQHFGVSSERVLGRSDDRRTRGGSGHPRGASPGGSRLCPGLLDRATDATFPGLDLLQKSTPRIYPSTRSGQTAGQPGRLVQGCQRCCPTIDHQ